MSFLVHATPLQAFARAYAGMWIADCACRNAMQINRFQRAFECDYCGQFYETMWPAENMVHSIERLLLMRPLPYTRNWFPGETLHDLTQENAEHGVYSNPKLAEGFAPATPLLIVDDEGIRKDMLPVTVQRGFKAVEA